MKIQTLLEFETPSSGLGLTANTAPRFGRSDKFLEEENIEETTTSGSVASVVQPMGKVRSRGSIFSGIKTSEKFPNSKSVKESDLDSYKAKQKQDFETEGEMDVDEAVTLDRSKVPNYPNDVETTKHRIASAKLILSDPNSDYDSRRIASSILAQSEKLLSQYKDTEKRYKGVAESESMADFFANKAKELYPHALVRKNGETIQEPPKREVPVVKQEPVDIGALEQQYAELKKKYQQLGGDSWQYADRMMPRDREAQQVQQQMGRIAHQIANAKKNQIDEAEISEEMLAHELYKDFQIFKKGKDKEIGQRAKSRDLSGKPKDKGIIAKVTKLSK